jgi:AraC-like DNA-binding protein
MDRDLIKITHKDPIPELEPYVKKVSVFTTNERICFTQKLTPSPYNYLSYNHLEVPISIFAKKSVYPKSRTMIAGIKTEEIYVKYEGKLQQILFEFTATGFYNLFHQSPARYKNCLIEAAKIVSTQKISKILHCVSRTDDVNRQIGLMEDLLLSKVRDAKIPNLYLEKSVSFIEENHGMVQIKDVADQAGICERQLNRKFREVVGISPKKFSRILQLHYLIYLIHRKEHPLQEIVFEGFFYDRPHFNHFFKELTGMTPVEFIRSNRHIAFEYFTNL